jgi:hypothetical protein
MRLTIGLAAMASLCLLAGCNKGAANNSANAPAPAPAANASAPVESAAPPAQTSAPVGAASGDQRAHDVQECANDVANELPAGTDVNAFCNCAVDGMAQNGGNERPAMEACATQMGIQPRR